MMMVMFAMSSFVKVNDNNSEKSCKVKIYYGNGDVADGVTVTAYYSGLSATWHDFKTNSDGVVTLTWESNYIKKLLIKGDKYDVDYEDGKSYTLTLKKQHKYD